MSKAEMVALGELVELCDERNTSGVYTLDDVRGISIEKRLINTKADMTDVLLTPYKIMHPHEFCYVTVTSRNGGKISLAMNDTDNTYIVSSSYTTFRSKDTKILLPEYLFLLLSRTEFDRYARFNSWGSARETFDWSEMCRVEIPLPDIEVQRELVAVYEGLKQLAEENEAMLEPLAKACEAFIVECKRKYDEKTLGEYIEECDERNTDGRYTLNDVRGISTDKIFIETKANLDGVSISAYKVVKPNEFAYVADTSRRGDKIALALNNTDNAYIISSIYTTFRSKDIEVLLPEYLFLLLSRKEFDRYARFNSWGSARETFDWNEMCLVEIPIPPIEVQEKIVELYTCYEECKRIVSEAREQLNTICPALVQRGHNSK